MVNTAFIHAMDDDERFMREYEENASEITKIDMELELLGRRRSDMKSLGIYMESQDDYYTESVSSMIEKLGDKIMKIIKQIKDFCKDFIKKITGKDKKEDKIVEDKIKKLQKENPVLADQVKVKLSQSDFNMNSMKDINEYYKSVDEIIEQLKKDNVDPKSLKGRWQKVKDGLVKNKEAVLVATSILTAAVGVGGLIIKAKQAKPAVDNCYKAINDHATKSEATASRLEMAKEHVEKMKTDNVAMKQSRLSMMADIAAYNQQVSGKNMTAINKLRIKILRSLGDAADKALIKQEVDAKGSIKKGEKSVKRAKKREEFLDGRIKKATGKATYARGVANIDSNIEERTRGYATKGDTPNSVLTGQEMKKMEAEQKFTAEQNDKKIKATAKENDKKIQADAAVARKNRQANQHRNGRN